jgi:exodeoxyribonuclease VII small subunit
VAEKLKSKNSRTSTSREPSFEAGLIEIEKITGRLESGDLTLDQALALFEQGISLLRICDGHLKNAQGRITELLKGENGKYVEKVLGAVLDPFIVKEKNDE